MTMFVMPNTDGGLGFMADKIAEQPEFADRFDAIKELRDLQQTAEDVPRVAKYDGFVRVASFVGPLLNLAEVLNPDFLRQKTKFYKFLDEHKQYCTYDRRKHVGGDGLFWGWKPEGAK